MHGASHLLISWFVAEAHGLDSPRDRRIVALSGLAPDIDVLAYAGAIVYYGFDKDLAFENVWQVVHHRYTHGLGFILLTGIVAFLVAGKFWMTENRRTDNLNRSVIEHAAKVAVLSMLVSVVHLFCDIVAGGPTWPVFPLWPLSDSGWAVTWSWTLAAWPNSAVLFGFLAGTMIYAKCAGYSPMEAINYRFDRWFVTIIQKGSDSATEEQPQVQTHGTRVTNSTRVRMLVYSIVVLLIIAVLAPLGFRLDELNLPQF